MPLNILCSSSILSDTVRHNTFKNFDILIQHDTCSEHPQVKVESGRALIKTLVWNSGSFYHKFSDWFVRCEYEKLGGDIMRIIPNRSWFSSSFHVDGTKSTNYISAVHITMSKMVTSRKVWIIHGSWMGPGCCWYFYN